METDFVCRGRGDGRLLHVRSAGFRRLGAGRFPLVVPECGRDLPPQRMVADFRQMVPVRQRRVYTHWLAAGERRLVLPESGGRYGHWLETGGERLVLLRRLRRDEDRLAGSERLQILLEQRGRHAHRDPDHRRKDLYVFRKRRAD